MNETNSGTKRPEVVQQTAEPEYALSGFVGWITDGGHDPDTPVGERLDERFTAKNDGKAVKIARDKIKAFLRKNRKYSPLDHAHDQNGWERFFRFDLTKTIWEMRYEGARKGRPAVPAEPTTPSTPARIMEITPNLQEAS